MTLPFRRWLEHKWSRSADVDAQKLAGDYQATFSSEPGQRVLRHLLDNVYCSVYEGKDVIEAAHHNGRRSVIQEVLQNIDMAEHADKYQVSVDEGSS